MLDCGTLRVPSDSPKGSLVFQKGIILFLPLGMFSLSDRSVDLVTAGLGRRGIGLATRSPALVLARAPWPARRVRSARNIQSVSRRTPFPFAERSRKRAIRSANCVTMYICDSFFVREPFEETLEKAVQPRSSTSGRDSSSVERVAGAQLIVFSGNC